MNTIFQRNCLNQEQSGFWVKAERGSHSKINKPSNLHLDLSHEPIWNTQVFVLVLVYRSSVKQRPPCSRICANVLWQVDGVDNVINESGQL